MKILLAARCGILFSLSGFLSLDAAAQQLKLGDNPSSVKKEAILELNSPNQGLLLPRVLKAEILSGGKLFTADDGMLVFVNDASEKSLYIKRNGNWEKVGDITTTLTGAVTGSGTGSIATTITNRAVTYGKIQDISAQSILGRYAATDGTAQELKLGNGLLLNNTNGLITADVNNAIWNASKLQGRNIAATAPAAGDVLKWNNTTSLWEPGAGGSATITLTGPITGSGTSTFATTITNKAVTYNKIQDVTSQSLLGRYSTGNGTTQEVKISTGLLLNNTNGNMTADYNSNLWNANKLQNNNIATTAPANGQVLKWNGTNNIWEPGPDMDGGATYATLPDNDIRKADAPGTTDRMKIWASPGNGLVSNGPSGTDAYSWNVLSFRGANYTTQLYFDKEMLALKEWSGNAAPLTSNAANPWYKVVTTLGNNNFTNGGLIFAERTYTSYTEVKQRADKLFWNNTDERLGVGTNAPTSTVHVNGSLATSVTTFTNTANVTLDETHHTVVMRKTGNNGTYYTVNLPNAGTCTGRIYYITRDFTSGWGAVSIVAPSGQFSTQLWGSEVIGIQSIGTRWITLSVNN